LCGWGLVGRGGRVVAVDGVALSLCAFRRRTPKAGAHGAHGREAWAVIGSRRRGE